MQKHPLVARGIRLHPELWMVIEARAEQEDRTISEYLRRQLEDVFQFDRRVHKVHEKEAS